MLSILYIFYSAKRKSHFYFQIYVIIQTNFELDWSSISFKLPLFFSPNKDKEFALLYDKVIIKWHN